MLKDLIVANRSYRRFEQGMPVDEAVLRELVDLARVSASGGDAMISIRRGDRVRE